MVATTRAPGASLKAPFASNCLSPFTIRPNSKSVEAGLPNQLPPSKASERLLWLTRSIVCCWPRGAVRSSHRKQSLDDANDPKREIRTAESGRTKSRKQTPTPRFSGGPSAQREDRPLEPVVGRHPRSTAPTRLGDSA